MTISYRLAEYKDIDTLIDMRMAYLKPDRYFDERVYCA